MHFVVVGGGVTGVTCVSTLSRLCPSEKITFLVSSGTLKDVQNVHRISRHLEEFDILERPINQLNIPNVVVVKGTVLRIDPDSKIIHTKEGTDVPYDMVCLCTGARPKILGHSPFVIAIRDTETLQDLQARLRTARRIVVVGNGGIALELVHSISSCEVVWAMRTSHIGNTFFDAASAAFFTTTTTSTKMAEEEKSGETPYYIHTETAHLDGKRHMIGEEHAVAVGPDQTTSTADIPPLPPPPSVEKSVTTETSEKPFGSALGPQWVKAFGATSTGENIRIEPSCQVYQIVESASGNLIYENTSAQPSSDHTSTSTNTFSSSSLDSEHPFPVTVHLSNGRVIPCDLIVCATGVVPNTDFLDAQFALGHDRGVLVDENMESSVPNVFAAGDCATVTWSKSPHWFQMRLWSQARILGYFAAHRLRTLAKERFFGEKVDEIEDLDAGMVFELFAHSTKFFGYKVVLLGLFNAQGLEGDVQHITRLMPGEQYVKLVIQNGRLQGATLIGETDLEETFENLILNGLDISQFGESILDPNVDIEDYFD